MTNDERNRKRKRNKDGTKEILIDRKKKKIMKKKNKTNASVKLSKYVFG